MRGCSLVIIVISHRWNLGQATRLATGKNRGLFPEVNSGKALGSRVLMRFSMAWVESRRWQVVGGGGCNSLPLAARVFLIAEVVGICVA